MLLAMMLSATWAVQAAPSAEGPPPDLTGKKVAFVEVAGAVTIAPETILAATRLKPGDVWTPDKVRQDLRLIYELGTISDVTADFTVIPEGVKVVYNVRENPVLKSIVVQGNKVVKTDKLLSLVTVKPGAVLNSKTVATNLQAIEEYYKGQGYILAKAGDVNFSPAGILTLHIMEGVIEDIVVKGNKKTKAYVVTREMRTKKGLPFNSKDARRSMQKLYNLGFFEDVNLKLLPGKQPGGTIMEITVVEQKTGTFSIGGGYSASDGIVGIITVGDKNFRGTGDNAQVRWEIGGKAETAGNFSVSYTKPWLDSKQTSLGLNLYSLTSQYTDYDTSGDQQGTYNRKYSGGDITLGRPVNDYLSHYVTLKNRNDSYVTWVSGPNYVTDFPYAPNYINANYGLTRSIAVTRVFDSRDNTSNPTLGTRYSIGLEFAGLGGNFNFNKNSFEIRHYWAVGKTQVLAVRGMLGFATGDLPYSQKFSLGGTTSLRGYRDDQFKGDRMIAASAEYRFPLAKRVQAVIFTDMGNAWTNNVWTNNASNSGSWTNGDNSSGIYIGYGAGVRLVTPFGPVRVDYGYGSQGGRLHFGFGGQF